MTFLGYITSVSSQILIKGREILIEPMQKDEMALKRKIFSKYFQILDGLYRGSIISFTNALFQFTKQNLLNRNELYVA